MREQPLSKTDIIQALRYHFELSSAEIRRVVNTSYTRIWLVTSGLESGSIPWWKRQYQKQSIEAARELLGRSEVSGSTTS